VRVRRMRMTRVRMSGPSVRAHRRRGAARVAGERVMRRVRLYPVLPGRRLLPLNSFGRRFSSRADSHRTAVRACRNKLLGNIECVPCGRGRSGERVMILRRCGCGRDCRSRRGNVDGRLKLLPVLLLLLLGLLLVIGACAVPAASATVEHPPRELPPRHLSEMTTGKVSRGRELDRRIE